MSFGWPESQATFRLSTESHNGYPAHFNITQDCHACKAFIRISLLEADHSAVASEKLSGHRLMPSKSSGWDHPFFKVLAMNDTGQASGHQSGLVVPIPIQQYLPIIQGQPCKEKPSIAIPLTAYLYAAGVSLGEVGTSYQVQSWRGFKREHRITSALKPLLGSARAGDILLLQRKSDSCDVYRLELLPQKTPQHAAALKLTGKRRWGVLDILKVPESFTLELEKAFEHEKERQTSAFSLFDGDPEINVSVVKKVARSLAFRKSVLTQYGNRCAICRAGLLAPTGLYVVEAAHVVPRSEWGADDVRNGIALCRNHHWAFDSGLFGVGDDLRVFVPPSVAAISENKSLAILHGKKIQQAADIALRVDPAAFRWHMAALVYKE